MKTSGGQVKNNTEGVWEMCLKRGTMQADVMTHASLLAMNVGGLATLVQTEISQQLFNIPS